MWAMCYFYSAPVANRPLSKLLLLARFVRQYVAFLQKQQQALHATHGGLDSLFMPRCAKRLERLGLCHG
eukprot:3372172-Pleurochrysis_carterae.AAC.1